MRSPDNVATAAPARPGISIVIPLFNEAATIADTLDGLRQSGWPNQLVIVDGQSTDDSLDRIAHWQSRHGDFPLTVLSSVKGRAIQMNTGAARAVYEVVLFLHADSSLPAGALDRVRQAVRDGAEWGRFDVRFDTAGDRFGRCLSVVAFFMNWRSALSGICTGDQALFVRRDTFRVMNGFPAQDLMEDIELSRRLKRCGWPARIRLPLRTSARRWRRHGVWRTVRQMWWLRLQYWLGGSPARLACRYDEAR